MSEETKAKMRASHLGKKHSQETKDAIGSAHAGKTLSAQQIAGLKASRDAAIARNGGKGLNHGQKRDQKFKDRMSEVALERTPEQVQAKVDAMLAVRRGSSATPEQIENYRNGTIKWMTDNPNRVFNTGVELAFKKFLTDNGIWFIQQYVIQGVQHPYDFYLPDYQTIVEIDGPQHWKMAIWGTSGKSQEQKDQILIDAMERDAELNLKAGKAGLRIVRVQVESSIETSPRGHFLDQMRIQGLIIQ